MLRLFDSFRYSATNAQIDAYISAVSSYSPGAVKQAVDRLVNAEVDRKHEYVPNAPELAQQARMFHEIEQRKTAEPTERLVSYPIGGSPPPGYEPLGPIEVDFGHGKINLRGMTYAEKMEVYRLKRLPDRADDKRIGFAPKFQRA